MATTGSFAAPIQIPEPRLRPDQPGVPRRLQRVNSRGIRRFPRFDITGYQGTGIGGEERPNETQSFIATLNKSAGAHAIKTGMEVRQYRETDIFFANNQTGQFNFD